jgi:membrane-bound ClpP family serine protease
MPDWDIEKIKSISIALFINVLILSGLFGIGYGLYLFKPWVSYSVVGGLLLMLGMIAIFMRR